MQVIATLHDGTILTANNEIELAQLINEHNTEHAPPLDADSPVITYEDMNP